MKRLKKALRLASTLKAARRLYRSGARRPPRTEGDLLACLALRDRTSVHPSMSPEDETCARGDGITTMDFRRGLPKRGGAAGSGVSKAVAEPEHSPRSRMLAGKPGRPLARAMGGSMLWAFKEPADLARSGTDAGCPHPSLSLEHELEGERERPPCERPMEGGGRLWGGRRGGSGARRGEGARRRAQLSHGPSAARHLTTPDCSVLGELKKNKTITITCLVVKWDPYLLVI